MGLFDIFKDDHAEVHHKANFTHEALAGAVAYEAAKAYEDHCAKYGRPANHTKAKEILAGFAGVALTRLAETKGLDSWDAHKQAQVQRRAEQRLQETVLVQQYGQY